VDPSDDRSAAADQHPPAGEQAQDEELGSEQDRDAEPYSDLDAEPTAEPTAAAPARLQATAARLRVALSERYEAQRYSFVPATERVAIDARQHVLVLVLPALRTVGGLALLLLGPLLLPLAWFALVTAVWARVRLGGRLKRSAITGGAAAVGVLVLLTLDGRRWDALLLVLLLLWLAEDLADWFSDRLVVTDKRIYRRHGVLTRHSPSISLMAIAYIDAAVPPLGQLLHYGTLRLDSVAQRDDPLSRFDLIPDVVSVSHEILRLRAAAMPKGPQQTA
jgi:hypothetical protein